MSNIDSKSSEKPSQQTAEFLDAIRRHICQILQFDCGFIDIVSGHEINNLSNFAAEDNDDTREFIESLVDGNKQPITVSNTLTAQKVKENARPWVGKVFSPEDVKKLPKPHRITSDDSDSDDSDEDDTPGNIEDDDDSENEIDGFPYAIVPVVDGAVGASGQVKGLIRVLSFDASREITTQDLATLKLMGEHMASPTGGLFGNLPTSSERGGAAVDAGELDEVLIIHSERGARRRLSRVLRKHFEVAEADSSDKALKMLDDTRADVILLDSEIKGTSGLAFCKVIKESAEWKHKPVIVIIPEDKSPSTRVSALEVGADDCIFDSCLDEELLARISSAMRHRKVEREQAVQLELLEDYAQRLEKAHEQLSLDRQSQIQRNSQLEQLRRESDIQRNQDNLLHRISNIIRKSFDVRENLEEMLEALSGWFSLDCAFVVMPSDEEPEDTLRVEYVTDKEYKVVDYDRDLKNYEIFKSNFGPDQSIVCNDATDRRLAPFHAILKSGFTIKSVFYIPISYEQKLLGMLVGYKCETRANWNRLNENFMKAVADQVAAGVVNSRLYARVQRQATTDGLTGLFNHRVGQEKLAEQLKQAERYQRHVSVIMLDVDHFKSINDTYGHPAGDSVLKAVSKLIKSNCRDVDIPVRYGGEEFLLVLPEINQEGAVVVAERIRKALQDLTIKHEQIEINVTGSFGVAGFPDDSENQQVLLELADKSLYLSKRLGRNQVHTASDLMFKNVDVGEEKAEDKDQENEEEEAAISVFTPPSISAEAKEQDELVPEVVEMVKSLAASLYERSEYNKLKHLEVARMSELLAKVMGLSAQQVEQIRVAGLLHDVGVLSLPEGILDKEGELTGKERKLIEQHPTLGADMLRPVRALKDICEILENHHERWDGTGYPKGLKGEEIPLPARIVAIVDSYHALVSQRPYRDAKSHDEAIKILQDGAGQQWDPFLIEIFVAVIKSMRDTKSSGAPQPAETEKQAEATATTDAIGAKDSVGDSAAGAKAETDTKVEEGSRIQQAAENLDMDSSTSTGEKEVNDKESQEIAKKEVPSAAKETADSPQPTVERAAAPLPQSTPSAATGSAPEAKPAQAAEKPASPEPEAERFFTSAPSATTSAASSNTTIGGPPSSTTPASASKESQEAPKRTLPEPVIRTVSNKGEGELTSVAPDEQPTSKTTPTQSTVPLPQSSAGNPIDAQRQTSDTIPRYDQGSSLSHLASRSTPTQDGTTPTPQVAGAAAPGQAANQQGRGVQPETARPNATSDAQRQSSPGVPVYSQQPPVQPSGQTTVPTSPEAQRQSRAGMPAYPAQGVPAATPPAPPQPSPDALRQSHTGVPAYPTNATPQMPGQASQQGSPTAPPPASPDAQRQSRAGIPAYPPPGTQPGPGPASVDAQRQSRANIPAYPNQATPPAPPPPSPADAQRQSRANIPAYPSNASPNSSSIPPASPTQSRTGMPPAPPVAPGQPPLPGAPATPRQSYQGMPPAQQAAGGQGTYPTPEQSKRPPQPASQYQHPYTTENQPVKPPQFPSGESQNRQTSPQNPTPQTPPAPPIPPPQPGASHTGLPSQSNLGAGQKTTGPLTAMQRPGQAGPSWTDPRLAGGPESLIPPAPPLPQAGAASGATGSPQTSSNLGRTVIDPYASQGLKRPSALSQNHSEARGTGEQTAGTENKSPAYDFDEEDDIES